MRISDWSSDVCSSDLRHLFDRRVEPGAPFLDMTIEVRFDGERQRPLLAKRVEGGLRDEVDRKSVVKGKSVSVRVDLGGRRINKKKKDCSQTNIKSTSLTE